MAGYVQPVNKNNELNAVQQKVFSMIDNYIYLYHTETLIALPTFPETIADNQSVTFSSATPLSRSAPIYSYSHSGPRSFQVSLSLHRDLMNEINTATSGMKNAISNLHDEDYIDIMIKQLQAAALPQYAVSEKMVNPPIVAVRFGDEIFCKGVIEGGVTVTYSGPIIPGTDGTGSRYALVNVDFNIHEIDPFDAETVMMQGSFRGFSTDLERRIWKA